ncbi:MAG: VOC family protein [Actinobacteria bacterium]|nr:MAG: VOC family protein [Actinomycetota bacterium]
MGNPVTWFEVIGTNAEQSAKFYSEVFGWSVDHFPEMNYHIFDTQSGTGIPGAAGEVREGQAPYSIVYIENPDIDALLAKTQKAGATVVMPVTEIPNMVTFAHIKDPFGNLIGLAKGDGTVVVKDGTNPPVDWFEISCVEAEKAYDWYRDVFGWTIKADPMPEGQPHAQIDTGGGIHGGIGGTPTGQPMVTTYALVNDLGEYLKRAENLGAKTVMEPMQVDPKTRIAAFVDPHGNMFGLYSTAS